ncbi:Tat pathway signal sequence [Collinsella tanakaei]|uniref:Tat pathway signal sequence n=1 Tax=Collinsella tanakaei TaxID=626935 RepID=UPI0025A38B8B|nr:Tat pathway signal sequence [Collinsella tanakaei]MDM8245362.1 Tat pathway signal sequence [Collinsella tanakaei]
MAHDHDDLFRMLRMMGVPVPENDSDDDAIPVDAVIGDAEDSADGGSTHDGSDDRHGGKHRKSRRGSSAHTGNEFFDALARWSKRAFIVAAIVLIVALAASYWWFHPALNLQSPQVWSWIILIAVVVAVALKILSLRSLAHGALFRRLIAVPIAVIIAFVVGVVAGFPFIPGNAERYATVLETTDGTFSEDIEEVDYSEVPVIDHASAVLLGDRAMGSIPEYVSQFEISSAYSQINYHGRPVRVSPLTYADLFKWFSNRNTGIPAYVLVDMVTQEAEVVRLDEPIKYSESEPLARNIDRYVQLKYPTYMFDQKSFELDEDGTPWWVFPVQRRTIGLFQGTTIQRVVLVNACTGETEDYAVEDVPTWVDRAYPSDLIIQQYNWSGMYANGWLNSWLGQRDVVRTTSGTNGELGYNYLAQGEDIYLYSGVSSVTADSSSIGFILVNQRTGESHFYPVAGATEDSAMASAEGELQNLRYQATFPLLLNVAGQPTYFMSMKDDAGLVKMYAMINVEHYQSVATGGTVAACQDSYLAMLAADGTLSEEQAVESGAQETVSGKIATIAQAVIDGNSHFYVTLEGSTEIYDFALPDLLGIVRYRVGDEISFTCTAEEVVAESEADDDAGATEEDSGALVRPVTAIE